MWRTWGDMTETQGGAQSGGRGPGRPAPREGGRGYRNRPLRPCQRRVHPGPVARPRRHPRMWIGRVRQGLAAVIATPGHPWVASRHSGSVALDTTLTHGFPLQAPARAPTVGGRVILTWGVAFWRWTVLANVPCRAARLLNLAVGWSPVKVLGQQNRGHKPTTH